jgi:hypothetical protein
MNPKSIDVTILESLNHLLTNHPHLLPAVYDMVHSQLGLPRDQLRWITGANRIPLVDIMQFDYDRQLGVEMDIRSSTTTRATWHRSTPITAATRCISGTTTFLSTTAISARIAANRCASSKSV